MSKNIVTEAPFEDSTVKPRFSRRVLLVGAAIGTVIAVAVLAALVSKSSDDENEEQDVPPFETIEI